MPRAFQEGKQWRKEEEKTGGEYGQIKQHLGDVVENLHLIRIGIGIRSAFFSPFTQHMLFEKKILHITQVSILCSVMNKLSRAFLCPS